MKYRGSFSQQWPGLLLCTFTGLFLGRVLGQILVVFFGVRSLPPEQEWYSGLLPYPILLPIQILMLYGMSKLNLSVLRGESSLQHYRPRLSRALLCFGLIYIGVMIARYFISGSLHPERRWFPPGILPIFFHWVLAAYVLTLSYIASRRQMAQ
jgi:hypothetical protein